MAEQTKPLPTDHRKVPLQHKLSCKSHQTWYSGSCDCGAMRELVFKTLAEFRVQD